MTRLLVYEPDISGHHLEFLHHLVDHFVERRASVRHLVCVVDPRLGERDPELEELARSTPEITMAPLSPEEAAARRGSATRVSRSLREWSLVERYGERHGTEHALLMHLNPFQLALGMPRAARSRMTLSGILLDPFVRMEDPDGFSRREVGRLLRRWRRRLLMGWMLRNRSLTGIFVLNDRGAAAELNSLYGREETFRELPDPIAPRAADPDATRKLEERYGLSDERMKFLLFGSLNRRKGAVKVLRAARRLETDVASRMTLLMLGKVHDELARSLSRELAETRRARPELTIVTDDRFLPTDEMRAAFEIADVVLAPYQGGMEGSSGILGHAAAAGRPVIGPERGLIGSLIRRYDLGTCVETTSVADLREALASYARSGITANVGDGSRRYVEERTPARFARRIFGSLS